MAIRGVLFDKDGTVIDYWRTWVPINREVALYAARGDHTVADELLRLGGHDPATDRITPGSALAAGDFLDIAEAFAAHPQVAPADQLVVGIERIFRSGGAQHSALIERRPRHHRGAQAQRLPHRARHQRLGGRAGGIAGAARRAPIFSISPWAAIPDSAPSPIRAWCWASARPSAWARARSPWLAMPFTTSPWAARRAWP